VADLLARCGDRSSAANENTALLRQAQEIEESCLPRLRTLQAEIAAA
jgi:hypothetical protein